LVAGALTMPLSKMVLSHVALEGPINRFRWHAPSVSSLFHFGKWIFLSTALTFFAGQSDRLIFAKLVPLEMLGVYSMAAMIALMPLTLFGRIERRVVFPVYSTVVREERELAPVFTRMRAGYLTAGGVICAMFVAAGPSLIEVLYDERYHEAGWILRYLTIGTWLTLVQTTYGAAHLATARVQWVAASSMCKVIGIIAFVLFGYEVAGFEGAVLGYALSEFLRYAVLAFGGRMMKLPGLGQDVFLTLVVVVTAWLGVMGGNVIPDAGAVMRTGVIGTIVGLLWAPLIYIHLGKAVALARRS
jgi:O-antigen/teichoic acid export membrane protein